MNKQWTLTILFLSLLFFASVHATLEYEVYFDGISDQKTSELIRRASDTLKLQDRPPRSVGSLQQRAEKDIRLFLEVYHSLAHYNANIDLTLDDTVSPIQILYNIEEGPIYPLIDFDFLPVDENDSFPYDCIRAQDLCMNLGAPAHPKDILTAEELFVEVMARMGYPLAVVHEREVLVDQTSKEVSVLFHVSSGPAAFFGPTTFIGNNTVCDYYLRKRLYWSKGDRYDPDKVNCTINSLESTGLFSAITIAHAPELSDEGYLPMTIQLKEGFHRSVGLGASFDTQRGIGGGFEWEHRNIRGMGEKISTSAFAWQKRALASALYVRPDFYTRGQDLLLLAEYERETTKAFNESAFSVSAAIERQLTSCIRYSYGIMYKQLHNTKTDNDGDFNLVKFPVLLRWNNTDDPLNPCCGTSLQLKTIPTVEIFDEQFAYGITTLTASMYRPLTNSCNTILAGKFLLGSIIGSNRKTIPGSERFYAGSENTLRGYKFYTVSPLDGTGDPIGGRSLVVYSTELRFRTTENLGWVGFYDIGNVFEEPFPNFDRKLLQSVGVGLRYFTPVAPLRFDVAFPLNPRKGLDNNYQLYLSVGQAF